MKKIVQRIYLILSAVALIVMSLSSFGTFISGTDGREYDFTSTSLVSLADNSVVSNMPWAILVLALLGAFIAFFTLFLTFFQNYELQKRLTIFNVLLMTGLLFVYLAFYLFFSNELDAIAFNACWWVSALPVVALILNVMAFNAIRSSEAAVLKEATSFRLRD